MSEYVSRAGKKLEFALDEFNIDVKDMVCIDFGCSTGGFTDCLLQRGAKKVYAIDTAYGELEYKLRINEKVVVMERQNALHVQIPEKVDIVVSDVNWTRQELIVPKGFEFLKNNGVMISLLKPHYEVDAKSLKGGKVDNERLPEIVEMVRSKLKSKGFEIQSIKESPVTGKKGGNTEFVMLIKKY